MRILITGASGQVGPYLVRRLLADDAVVIAWGRFWAGQLSGVSVRALDLTDRDQVAEGFEHADPEVVVHAAAISQVSRAYDEPELAQAVNVNATRHLSKIVAERQCRLIYLSTDMVFDGEHAPYQEEDTPAPVTVYGRTKLESERVVLETNRSLVMRLSLLFGPSLNGRPKFFDNMVTALREHRPIRLFTDESRTVMGLSQAAEAIAATVRTNHTGLFHVGGPLRMSRFDLGLATAKVMQLDHSLLIRASRLEMNAPEPRPRDLSLDTTRWRTAFAPLDRPDFQTSLRGMLGLGESLTP